MGRLDKRAMKQKLVDIAILLLRLASGLIIFEPGADKILHWYGVTPPEATQNPQILIGGWMELVGGALILLGLGTRATAFILSGEMAVAYFQFHQPGGTWPIQNHGQPAALLAFIFLFIAAFGAGPYSLDALIARNRKATSGE